MPIGFIGSGAIGATLAKLCVGAGLEVVIGNSRGPESLSGLIAELGKLAKAATADEVARKCEVVVVSVPFHRCAQLPSDALRGKVVVDTMNYYPHRDDRVPELDRNELSPSEFVQRHLAGSRVVKAFNILDYRHLLENARPASHPDRSGLPIAGDDSAAKSAVANLMGAIGYDAVDVGPLSEGWRFGPGMPVYALPYVATSPIGMTEEEQRRWFLEAPGTKVSVDKVRQLIAAADRGMPISRIPGYVRPA